jgi:CubicO group peptidase (beta-lactamase class C family)
LWFALLALFSFTGAVMSEPAETKVDALFQEFSGADAPGATVMVIKSGKIVLAKAYGMADLEKKVPCETRSNFRLASVTKQFTAMSVLMLAERRKVSLDDDLVKFFPEFPEYGKQITVRQLLSHTGGLIDYEDVIPAGTTIPLSDRDVLTITRQQAKTYFKPGTKFRYSNTGYALLALIVEQASGQTFPAFLEQNIFAPLQMTNSVAYVAGLSVVPHRAFGYLKEGNGWKFNDQSLTSAVLGDGGIYSSIVDLYYWDQALYGEKLVSRKMLEEAFSAHSGESDEKGSGYGYGWYVGRHRDTRFIWHYGSTCGFSTRLLRVPDKQLTAIILTNRPKTELNTLWPKLVDLYW